MASYMQNKHSTTEPHHRLVNVCYVPYKKPFGEYCISQLWKVMPALVANNFQRRPPIFLHVFNRAPGDIQLCITEFKRLALSVRYSTCMYSDLETLIRGHSKSVKVVPFDR